MMLKSILFKKNFLIIVITLLLLIAACTAQKANSSKVVDVRIGISGLAIEFLKNTPPQKVFEDEVFPVILKVRNIGAFSLDKGNKAILSLGVEKDYTKEVKLLAGGKIESVNDNAAAFNLEGRSNINTKGEEEVISYNIKAGIVDPQSEFHGSTVIATLCYPYETTLSSTVCIDADVSNIIPGKKVCNVQDIVFDNGQGAPVAVTKVEPNMLPQIDGQNIIPQFLIFIENKGTGTVVNRNAVQDFCTKSSESNAASKNVNAIFVRAYLSNEELDCTPKEKEKTNEKQGFAKLKDKKELIRCTLKEGRDKSLGTYSAPLKVVLSYGYTQSISANYFIQKTAR